MAWRSILIASPASLAIRNRALQVAQGDGTASVPLEDIGYLVIDHPQVSLTAGVLAECADRNIPVLTVGPNHLPNGLLLSFLPHHRALKVIRAQMDLGLPAAKRMRQSLIRQKIQNQSAVALDQGHDVAAEKLSRLAARVRSGDPENIESQAALVYFKAVFGSDFARSRPSIENAAINYGYAVARSALARSLVGHGFLPAFGLFHRSEQNQFNLADDLIEPFRPLVDSHVLHLIAGMPDLSDQLTPSHKAGVAKLLHRDLKMRTNGQDLGASTLLAAAETLVESLARIVVDGHETDELALPIAWAVGPRDNSDE